MHPLLFLTAGLATLVTAQNNTRVTGKLGDARQARNNPVIGEVWVAKFDGPVVKGTVTAVAHTVGVNYTIDVTGLPVENGPYSMSYLSLPSFIFNPSSGS